MSEHDAIHERGRALEDEYFYKKNRELVERMRRATAESAARARMGQTTGLSDPELLRELQSLGFTPETVSLLPLVPLVEVAWAEGGVHGAERKLILEFARGRGIGAGSPADRQLNEWLDRRPDPHVFERAGHLIAAVLDSRRGDMARGLTPQDLVAHCEQIAGASGGIFGTSLRSVTPEERELLTRIAHQLSAGTA